MVYKYLLGEGLRLEKEMWWTVKVPVSLVLDAELAPRARALYLTLASLCRSGEYSCSLSMADLRTASGQSRNTVRRHLRALQERGWVTVADGANRTQTFRITPAAASHTVAVPVSLLYNTNVPPSAKCLYAVIQSYWPKHANSPKAVWRELVGSAGFRDDSTLRTLRAPLTAGGWMVPRRFAPLDPHLALREVEMKHARQRMRRADFVGEALMKELLNLLVSDDRFQDNARPGFLENPLTGERLEFDRWYTKAGVAFEFNGEQHYRTSAKFADPEQLRLQRTRDLIKVALAWKEGIQLITLHATDLTLDRLSRKIAGVLPLREVRLEDPVVQYLRAVSRKYTRHPV